MTLTIKQMDDINVQLTEIALELLGNRFFDIHGQRRRSLGHMNANNMDKNPNYDENHTELMEWLGITTSGKSVVSRKTTDTRVDEQNASAQPSTSRHSRRSSSRIDDPSTSRRHTTGPIVINEARHDPLADDHTVEFQIKQSVSDETIRMTAFSDRMKEKHYMKNKSRMESEYLDEFELVNEYHTKEKEDLMMESCALIDFIKFIRNQPENASKMDEITKHILSVKDQL